jgi:hypothetical protein
MKKIFTLFIVIILACAVQAFSEITKLDPPELISPRNGEYIPRSATVPFYCKVNKQIKYALWYMYNPAMFNMYRDSIYCSQNNYDTIQFRSICFNRCGIWTWFVKAIGENGDTAISETWQIFVSIARSHYDLKLIYPPNDTTNQPVNIKFRYYIDLYNDSVYKNTAFQLVIRHDSTGITKWYNINDINEFENTELLKPLSKYHWSIIALDSGYDCPNTSEIRSFTTMAAPGKPNLISPINDEMNVSYNPRVVWEPVPEAKSYELNCLISPDTIIYYQDITDNFFDIPYTLKPLDGCYWRVRAYNDGGPGTWSEYWYFVIIDINAVPEITKKLPQLFDNIPNPLSVVTKFRFTLPESGFIKLSVSNAYGEEIAMVTSGFYDSGFQEIEWTAPNLPSGVYYYTLSATGFMETKKMVVIR